MRTDANNADVGVVTADDLGLTESRPHVTDEKLRHARQASIVTVNPDRLISPQRQLIAGCNADAAECSGDHGNILDRVIAHALFHARAPLH